MDSGKRGAGKGMHTDYVDLAPQVAQALADGRAVVALESTLIAHGLPYPQNLQTALEVEEAVRQTGAVPATIGIIRGKIRVGLSPEDLELIALARDVYKASRLDIPVLTAKGWSGATTVAATTAIASRIGIPIFATGGIGGVHRDFPETFDVSADLTELSKSDVCVVCAGVKSVLDIDWTLEYLETLGIPVLGYQTDEFPAFYARTSGSPVDYRVESAAEVAQIIHHKWGFGLDGGVVVANPIPQDSGLDSEEMEDAIEEALDEAAERGIRGKAVTPFLLSYLQTSTTGETLHANVALVKNNARVAGEISVAYASLASPLQDRR